MKPKLYLFTAIAILSLASCRTAKKMYEKGRYDEAVELAAKKLQKDPGDPKLRALLNEAYEYAVNDHESEIRSLSNSSNELKWEWIYNEYASLQKMYEAIFRVPSVFQVVSPTDYSAYLHTYAEKAGDVRFDRGLYHMETGTKQAFRQAYREFQAALRFKPGHRDIAEKSAEAYELAVTNVIVLPLQQYGGYIYSGYTPGAMNLDDQLVRELQYNSGSEFTRFYSAWNARSAGVRPDLELDMQLVRLDLGYPRETRDQRRVSKEIVVKETVYKPDSVIKEYATVHATITTTRRTLHSEALMQVYLREPRGGRVWHDAFSAYHNWTTQAVTFTGDQRALSQQDRDQLNQGGHIPPHEQDITRYLLDEISRDAVHRVRNYFSSFE